jgi:hypothetical protein
MKQNKQNNIDLKELVERVKTNRSTLVINCRGVTSAQAVQWLAGIKAYSPGGKAGKRILKEEIALNLNREYTDGLGEAEEMIDRYIKDTEGLCKRVSLLVPVAAKGVPVGF